MVLQADPTRILEQDLDQIDPSRTPVRQSSGRVPATRQGLAPEAHPGAKARPDAPGLDLHHDQSLALAGGSLGAALDHHQVELAPTRRQPSCEEAPALCAQAAFDQQFSGSTDLGGVRIESQEGQPGSQAHERGTERVSRTVQGPEPRRGNRPRILVRGAGS